MDMIDGDGRGAKPHEEPGPVDRAPDDPHGALLYGGQPGFGILFRSYKVQFMKKLPAVSRLHLVGQIRAVFMGRSPLPV